MCYAWHQTSGNNLLCCNGACNVLVISTALDMRQTSMYFWEKRFETRWHWTHDRQTNDLSLFVFACLYFFVCIKVKITERRREIMTPRPEQHLAEYQREVREHTHTPTHMYRISSSCISIQCELRLDYIYTRIQPVCAVNWPSVSMSSWLMFCRKWGTKSSGIMRGSWSNYGRITRERWTTSERNTLMRSESLYTSHIIANA